MPDPRPGPRPTRIEPTSVECLVTPLPWRAWAVVAGVLSVLALLAWLAASASDAIWPDPTILAPIHEFAQNDRDHAVFALEHARSPARDDADVLILGSSAPRAALWDDATLNRVSGAHFVNLSSSAQNPLESLFLLQQRPLRRGQTVALFVGVSLLGLPNYSDRLEFGGFLQSPLAFADANLAANPAATFIPATWRDPTQRRMIALRGARSLLARYLHYTLPQRVARAVYRSPGIAYQDFCCRAAESRQLIAKRLADNAAINMAKVAPLLDAIAHYCAQQGARLVLFESPAQTVDREHLYRNWWQDYHALVRAVALRHHVPYVDVGEQIELPESAYTDAIHLTLQGRGPWSEHFLHAVAQLRKAED